MGLKTIIMPVFSGNGGQRLIHICIRVFRMSVWQERLVDLSSLTTVQFETLQLYFLVKEGRINLHQALKNHRNRSISRGTYYRILAQARKNVLEAAYTLVLATQMGLVKAEDLQRLFSTVSGIPTVLDESTSGATIEILQTLVTRIVMSR